MCFIPITKEILILQPHYTHRLLYNYEHYEKKLLNNKTELLGVIPNPQCYGCEKDTPEYYPENEEIRKYSNIKGTIIIKLKEEINKQDLDNIIDKINDFCAFFDLNNIYRIEQTQDYYLIEFDTESG